MASLYKKATPTQERFLKIIMGAVRNTAHHHNLTLPKNFHRSVAKRAVGTLTAEMPDVLAPASAGSHKEDLGNFES